MADPSLLNVPCPCRQPDPPPDEAFFTPGTGDTPSAGRDGGGDAQPARAPAGSGPEGLDVFGEANAALFDSELAEREAHLSANIKVGYRAPRGVKPHGWLGSAAMMGVEAWLSCINWSVLYGFHQSVFWHFTGAQRYADVLCGDAARPCAGVAAGVGWGAAAACSVVLLPLALEVPLVLRFVTGRHNLLTLGTALLLSATVVTDVAAYGEGWRTGLLGVGSASVMLSLAAVASCPAVNPRLRRQPWAVVLGLLILLCIRFGRASAHPLLQAEGSRTLAVKLGGCATAILCSLLIIKEGKGCCAKVDRHPEEEMAKLKVALTKLEEQYASLEEGHKGLSSELVRVSQVRASLSTAAGGGSSARQQQQGRGRRKAAAAKGGSGSRGGGGEEEEEDDDDQVLVPGARTSSLHHAALGTQYKDYRKVYDKYTSVRSKLHLYKVTARDNDYGRQTKGWLWLLIGPPLASALALTLWLFTSAGLVGRLVGVEPFRHSAALLLVGMSFGLGLNGLLTMHGVLLQLWATVLVCVGMALLLHADNDAGYAGGVLLAVALPSIWWITLGSVRKLAVHGAVGRVFGCAAVFLWFYLLLYSAAEAELGALSGVPVQSRTPIFGSTEGLHGTLVPFGWIVSGIWVFCTLFEWFIDYKNGQATWQQAQQKEGQGRQQGGKEGAPPIKIDAEKPQLCRLHKQSLWKPFLSAWMPAVVVMAVISLSLLSTVLLWNASQMWRVDTSHNLDDALGTTHDGSDGARMGVSFTIATYNVAGGYDSVGADSTACVAHLLQQINGDGSPDNPLGIGMQANPYGHGELGSQDYMDFTTTQRLRALPLLIGLQESDTVKWTRGNRDLLGSIARTLSLYEFLSFSFGGQRGGSSGGIGTLSQLPFLKQDVVPFASPDDDDASGDGDGGTESESADTAGSSPRVFTCVQVDLGADVTLSVINAQLGFSADGATQRSQIEQLIAYAQSDAVTGGTAAAGAVGQPVVITADMRLFADGKSTDPQPGSASAWAALTAAGFRSVTPIGDSTGERVTVAGESDGGSSSYTYFAGAATTIDFGVASSGSDGGGGEALREGLQVDYIWYKGLELATDDEALPGRFRSCSQPGAWQGGDGWAVPHATLCDEDDCAIPVQLEENLGLGHWTTPQLQQQQQQQQQPVCSGSSSGSDGDAASSPSPSPTAGDEGGADAAGESQRSVVCSYHRPVVAAFRRP